MAVRPTTRRTALERVCDHTFLPALLAARPVVVDLGANRGEFTRELVRRFDARSVAVEPNPALADGVAASGAEHVISAAIATDDGPVRLAIHPNDQESTIHAGASADLPGEMVRGVTLSSLLDEIELVRIDLLKVDIEGMEIDALTRLRDDQLAGVDQITVEFHDSQGWNDREDRRKVATRLGRAGFDEIRMSVRHSGDVLYVRRARLSPLELLRVRFVERPGAVLQRVQRRLRR